ncbi:MAG: methyltransferase domain-containing protein [Polyangia bacterium]
MKPNRAYYDEFAARYDDARHAGYHALIDRLEVDLVRRYGTDARVLEAGCGTGLILARVAEFASSAVGIDLSPGMLQKAHERGLRVANASITELPFADASFDVAYSFKVLAHIEAIGKALSEMARVVRPGGHVLAEFYNTRSLRYLVKQLKPATPISDATTDEAVYTRYDSITDIQRYLPPDLELVDQRGVRIFTPVSHVHNLPFIGPLMGMLETRAADAPILSGLGGFLIVVLRKKL